MAISNITLNNTNFEAVNKPVVVAQTNKVTLANASNKSDVYPVTYANCVKVTEDKTLDEILIEERDAYLNVQLTELIKKIQTMITLINAVDASLQESILKLEQDVNARVGGCAGGLSLSQGEAGKTIALKLGKGLVINQSDQTLTLNVAPPLYLNLDGYLSLNYDASDFVLSNNKLSKK